MKFDEYVDAVTESIVRAIVEEQEAPLRVMVALEGLPLDRMVSVFDNSFLFLYYKLT